MHQEHNSFNTHTQTRLQLLKERLAELAGVEQIEWPCEGEHVEVLNTALGWLCPRLEAVPTCIWSLKSLRLLDFSYQVWPMCLYFQTTTTLQDIKIIPAAIGDLVNLVALICQSCLQLTNVSPEIASLANISSESKCVLVK